MSNWWVAELWAENPILLVSWVAWVIGSIVLHELGHGWAAIRAGDRTPIETGHMTWNPVVHMGGMSLIVFAVVGIAWGAMPVNPSRFRRRHDDAMVAFAGPAMNLSLAIVSVLLAVAWGVLTAVASIPDPLGHNVFIFFHLGAMLNVVLFLFNLAPVPPLDGSRILASFVPPYERFIESEQGRTVSLIAFLIFFWWGSDYVFDAGGLAVMFVYEHLAGAVSALLP